MYGIKMLAKSPQRSVQRLPCSQLDSFIRFSSSDNDRKIISPLHGRVSIFRQSTVREAHGVETKPPPRSMADKIFHFAAADISSKREGETAPERRRRSLDASSTSTGQADGRSATEAGQTDGRRKRPVRWMVGNDGQGGHHPAVDAEHRGTPYHHGAAEGGVPLC